MRTGATQPLSPPDRANKVNNESDVRTQCDRNVTYGWPTVDRVTCDTRGET